MAFRSIIFKAFSPPAMTNARTIAYEVAECANWPGPPPNPPSGFCTCSAVATILPDRQRPDKNGNKASHVLAAVKDHGRPGPRTVSRMQLLCIITQKKEKKC